MKQESGHIFLESMVFYGYHGALPEERALGQRFVVDVELGVDLQTAGRTDELSQTVDYGEVYETVRKVVEGRPLTLIEAVAERIAAGILKDVRVLWVRVRVRKPAVPIRGSLAAAGVEIVRVRAT